MNRLAEPEASLSLVRSLTLKNAARIATLGLRPDYSKMQSLATFTLPILMHLFHIRVKFRVSPIAMLACVRAPS